MQVYVELAVLENFCMDFTLLYCAKLASKNAAGWRRIAFASALGACFAVVYPLFGVGGAAAVAIKLASGLALCLSACKFKRFKTLLGFICVFAGFCFLLGGALIAIFSFTGKSSVSGSGYLISSVPIGIPMFGALMLIIAARKIKRRLTKTDKSEVEITIFKDGAQVTLGGFFDSGNRVSYHGSPVSVIPSRAARKLVDEACITSAVKIHTVAGSRKLKVFTADKMQIRYSDKCENLKDVVIGISPQSVSCAVLNCDLLEE